MHIEHLNNRHIGDMKIIVTSIIIDYAVFSCKQILELKLYFTIKHICRDVNFVAHHFATIAINYSISHVWVEPQDFVKYILNYPCSFPFII